MSGQRVGIEDAEGSDRPAEQARENYGLRSRDVVRLQSSQPPRSSFSLRDKLVLGSSLRNPQLGRSSSLAHQRSLLSYHSLQE